MQAQFISLRTQADDAVIATTLRMKTERDELAKEDINTLHNFSKDFPFRLRGGGFAPRHLNRCAAILDVNQIEAVAV
ncbi:MAG: hypothetical protein LC778_07965 [Acidobacteria bacterium]|nr:hypothetical protein [Acidobacteriota bacterium]